MRTQTLIDPRRDPRLENSLKFRPSSDLPKAQSKKSVAIILYPDDEGVRLNNGRPGANEGPQRILYYLGRMVQLQSTPELVIISDKFSQLKVSERHEAAEAALTQVFEKGYRAITLGGGHDYGFPDASAFYRTYKGKILNVDAHMDVRPVVDYRLNSGTAFYRFAEKFSGRALVEWGIRPECNAESQMAWAKLKGIKVFDYTKPMPKIAGKVGLSICLDAFEGIRGVSAPAIVGLETKRATDLINFYSKRCPWLGLYECAPRYDPQNEDSARFAGILAHRYIHCN